VASTVDAGELARDAYDALAPAYDLLTEDYEHDRWLAGLIAHAERHGLRGKRVLDVACGTGKSFAPLLDRGYEITGCDISAQMLARASARAPGARLVEADMRALPPLGAFDLVTCLDDALNYVTEEDDLLAVLRGVRRSLSPTGLAIWDVNTQAMYRDAFARTWAVEDGGGRLVLWRGRVSNDFALGGVAVAVIDVFEHGPGGWMRSTSRHEQRHWPASRIASAAETAGLELASVLGQRRGAHLEHTLDEDLHPKAVFVARRQLRSREEVTGMSVGRP
jgi:ubiquinone/menaquinone biosynthesis C-methylase UbiE